MLNCPSCTTNLEEVEATVRLDDQHHLLFCPLCGANMGTYQSERLFFDDKVSQYRYWVETRPDPTHPDPPVTVQETRGGLQFLVTAHPLSIYTCLFERVFVLRTMDAPQGEPDPPHFSPVRPDCEYLLKSCDPAQLSNAATAHRIYNVVTATGWVAVASLPAMEIRAIEKNRGPALYVWPNFVASRWNRYYVGFHHPAVSNLFGSGSLESVVSLDPATGQQAMVRKSPRGALGAQLHFVPSRIVLRWECDGLEYHSCWKTDLDRQNAPHLKPLVFKHAEQVNLGFDFGTTNTAAAISYRLPDEERIVKEPLAIHDRTLRLLDGIVGNNINWLPQPVKASDPLATLPSQLLFESAQFADILSVALQAPHQYTIPYYQAEDSAGSVRSLGQFKWAKTLEALSSKALTVRQLYLRLALELFLAEVVAEHRIEPTNISLVATYPLAFNDQDMKLHNTSFEEVRKVVQPATGFTIAIGPPLDESHAGQKGDLRNTFSRYSLFIDVGGGTTDICISRRDDADNAVLAIDSCEYGGEDLNARVCGDGYTQLYPQQFRCRIRTNGAQVFRSPDAFSNKVENWSGVKRLMVHFQRGLVETAARFAIAQTTHLDEDDPLFVIYMLGLGWFSVFAELAEAEAIAAKFCTRVQTRLTEMKAKGLTTKLPRVQCIYPPNPKLIVARGAAACTNPDVAALSRDRKSYLLQDLEFVSGFQQQTLPWITPIPYKSPAEIIQLRLADVDRFTFESTVTLSGKTTWKTMTLQDCIYPEDTIRHSPFRIFLASYKNANS